MARRSMSISSSLSHNPVMPLEIPDDLTARIDHHLSRSEVMAAISLLREATNCSIADAKAAIGTRFRDNFPNQFSAYQNVGDDD